MLFTNISKEVPTYNKKELLLYIVENAIEVTLQITTTSGNYFKGYVLTISEVMNEGTIVLMQLSDGNTTTKNILHINLANIESVVFLSSNDIDVIQVLSKGKIEKPKMYSDSSRLDVKRKFKHFSETVFEKTGVHLEILPIDLPEDRKQLNRIYQITEHIQELLVTVLLQEDAKESWLSKFTEIKFVEHDILKVETNSSVLNIHFPFTNISVSEINESDFNALLLENL
ncbi:hypothetical protein [Tenacibaculum agarivorans]|uniref:hypothetical protein n=1 Tax=Tenacibaculum agarivorans TaxID=1908389 RepID=UPI00094BC553|nr:hypothetical protein [Tenacibaculum agarivorans]